MGPYTTERQTEDFLLLNQRMCRLYSNNYHNIAAKHLLLYLFKQQRDRSIDRSISTSYFIGQ